MRWELWIAVAALVLALAAVVIGLLAWRAVKARTPSFSADDPATVLPPAPSSGPPAVIVNPSKTADFDDLRELITLTAAEAGMPEPIWLETTVADPGLGQTREALARGASVVIAAGGDGTVRAVAEGLAGTGVPMGLLPLGTGNLLARNLDLPLGSRRELVVTALTGRDRHMDLGWLRTEPLSDEDRAAVRAQSDAAVPAFHDDPTREHVFLVIGGLGFDAAMVAGADDDLKAKLGWIAYFVAGVQHLRGRKIHATADLGDSGPGEPFKARTVLFANVGRLPGGVVLFPDAQLDDGWLDIAAIDTTGGLIGWVDLLRKVLLQGMGVRKDLVPYRTASIEFKRARSVVVSTEVPEQVQVDGDLVGYARTIHARVEKGGLVVRTQ